MKQALAALAFALGATLAAAQAGGSATPARSGSKESRPPSGSATPGASDAAKRAWERTHRASRIIGMDVVNRQGEKVGDVEDIVLDRSGNAAYAVVSTGGFLGVGDRLHAVPWRALEANAGTGQFILDIDKETLGKAPGFDNTTFPDVNDPKWSAENRKHFMAANSAAARSATMGSESGPPKKRERDDARAASGRSPTGSDIGPHTSTSRRSGPAAGAASSTGQGQDAGSASATGAGAVTPADSARRPEGTDTNSAGGAAGGNAPAPASPASGNGSTPGPLK